MAITIARDDLDRVVMKDDGWNEGSFGDQSLKPHCAIEHDVWLVLVAHVSFRS